MTRGRRLVRALAAIVAGIGLTTPAIAQPSVDWSGGHAGLFAGHGWGRASATAPYDAGPGFFYNFGGSSYSFDADGFFGGVSAGYDRQVQGFIYGLEAEAGYLGLRGSGLDPNGLPAFDDTTTSFKSDFYGALYARFGVAVGNALFYAKAGGALLAARASTIDPCVAPPASCGTETLSMRGHKTMPGWSLGAGVEWLAAPHWSVKAEYAYFDFGKLGVAGASNVGDPYMQRVDVRAHTAKVGMIYRFAH